ncbi:hypothetical protein GCM10007384_19460 [Aquimarina muelleri]|uniref:Uncharacterized protein n=2 Tax=Aquimarina muelleri TaxID=279356 RepID=A0A918JW55_9FLAO|nr:hypothetical protein GCM10007384_19460 [Aquimarina muelleri]
MKKQLIILSGLLLLLAGGFGLWKLNKDFLLLWNSNSINVTASSPLAVDKIKIQFGIGVNTISRSTDSDLLSHREKYTVLYDGKAKDRMINDYGENDFLITYNNEYYFSFRQFKFNRRHQHNYNFHFFQKDTILFIRADIQGQDAMKFETPMLEINLVDKYRCNVPVDNAAVIYNMIELVDPYKK